MKKVLVKAYYRREYAISLHKIPDTGRYEVAYSTANMKGQAVFSFKNYDHASTLFDAKMTELQVQYT
jgi:hypothetical protein